MNRDNTPFSPVSVSCDDLDMADCINETCPWSGKPVQADSLTEYDGNVVGFYNLGGDQFESAVRHFENVKAPQAVR